MEFCIRSKNEMLLKRNFIKMNNTAFTPNGGAINTAQVANSLIGQNKVEFGIANNNSAKDLGATYLFHGADKTDAQLILPTPSGEGATIGAFLATGEFATYVAMQKVFQKLVTQLGTITMRTDNTDNWSSKLVFEEMLPTGKVNSVSINLSKYATNTGTGYSNTLVIPASDLTQIKWPGLAIKISNIVADSKIEFEFECHGVNKAFNLVSLDANKL